MSSERGRGHRLLKGYEGSTFRDVGSRSRILTLGASFLQGAAFAFDPFALAPITPTSPRDPHRDAQRLAVDAQSVFGDFSRAVSREVGRRGA